MRATDGTTWLPIAESATIARVRVETIRQWINRGKVAHWKLSGRVWVRHDDVLDCELDWARRARSA